MFRPQNSNGTRPRPQNQLIWALKVKNDPKIKSKTKVRIEENIENKSRSTKLLDPKKVFQPYPDPKNSPLGPQKVKIDTEIKSKSKVRIEGMIENKSCSQKRQPLQESHFHSLIRSYILKMLKKGQLKNLLFNKPNSN